VLRALPEARPLPTGREERIRDSSLRSRMTQKKVLTGRSPAIGTTGQCESENMRDASFPLDPESERPSSGFRDGHWVQGSAPAG
jgi:hypothetical protein